MVWPEDDFDGVAGLDEPLFDYSKVDTEALRSFEAFHETGIAHPDSELEARETGLGHLEDR
ncbi:MAG TPA: hypothetical protein VF115_06020 [Acidimicrobiia bacterium]